MSRTKIFFKARKYYLKTNNKLIIIPKIFLMFCKIINRSFNSGIPVNESVNEFIAPHGFSGIFISKSASIGKNCTIFQQVTIGLNDLKKSKNYGAPKIGNNVYIGAGAKIIGNIKIADNVKIGANCVVTENIPFNSTVVLEHPRIIMKDGEKNE